MFKNLFQVFIYLFFLKQDLQYVFSKYVEAWFFLLKPTE